MTFQMTLSHALPSATLLVAARGGGTRRIGAEPRGGGCTRNARPALSSFSLERGNATECFPRTNRACFISRPPAGRAAGRTQKMAVRSQSECVDWSSPSSWSVELTTDLARQIFDTNGDGQVPRDLLIRFTGTQVSGNQNVNFVVNSVAEELAGDADAPSVPVEGLLDMFSTQGLLEQALFRRNLEVLAVDFPPQTPLPPAVPAPASSLDGVELSMDLFRRLLDPNGDGQVPRARLASLVVALSPSKLSEERVDGLVTFYARRLADGDEDAATVPLEGLLKMIQGRKEKELVAYPHVQRAMAVVAAEFPVS